MNRKSSRTRREFLLAGTASLVAAALPVGAEAKGTDASPLTPGDVEGPFYRPDAPLRANLRGDNPNGEPFFLTGTILSHPARKPLVGVVVEIWHCNHEGHYDNEAADFDPHKYLLRGKVKTDAQGRYAFETTLPVPYGMGVGEMRPAHVHYKVFAEGFTQMPKAHCAHGTKWQRSRIWALRRPFERPTERRISCQTTE